IPSTILRASGLARVPLPPRSHRMPVRFILACSCLFLGLLPASAQDAKQPAAKDTLSVEQLAAKAKASIVVIHHTGREGKRDGLGAGFVVSADGLIATNLHVIGDARPITVQLANGTKHDVISVHASDRSHDLALVKIAAKN